MEQIPGSTFTDNLLFSNKSTRVVVVEDSENTSSCQNCIYVNICTQGNRDQIFLRKYITGPCSSRTRKSKDNVHFEKVDEVLITTTLKISLRQYLQLGGVLENLSIDQIVVYNNVLKGRALQSIKSNKVTSLLFELTYLNCTESEFVHEMYIQVNIELQLSEKYLKI